MLLSLSGVVLARRVEPKAAILACCRETFLISLKKAMSLGLRARPPPFDVMDAQFVQLLGDADLVRHQKRNVFRLGSVAQGGIVQLDQTHCIIILP